MLDESNDINMETPAAPPPEESNNRTFLIVGGIMAGLVFLTLVCMAVYFLWLGPKITAQRASSQATVEAGNVQLLQQRTATAEAALWTPTLPPSLTPSNTFTPAPKAATATPTPVLKVSSPTQTPITDSATLVAMQTQLSVQMTSTAGAVGAAGANAGTRALGGEGMPSTGFFDEVGLPSLVILTLALVAVIFLARRLRKSPAK
jgi:hypothetical protein